MVASEVKNDQAKLQEDIVKGSSGGDAHYRPPLARGGAAPHRGTLS